MHVFLYEINNWIIVHHEMKVTGVTVAFTRRDEEENCLSDDDKSSSSVSTSKQSPDIYRHEVKCLCDLLSSDWLLAGVFRDQLLAALTSLPASCGLQRLSDASVLSSGSGGEVVTLL